MYNCLQLAKSLSKFYKKELKAAEREATIISLPFTLDRFLAYEPPDQELYQQWTRVGSTFVLKKPK